jgi:hypothetical protein
LAQIRLSIDAPGSAASATNMLLDDLRRHARVDVRHAPTRMPDDAKSGTGMAIAELVVNGALPAAGIAAAASVITAFIERRSARKVVLKSGEDEITVEGLDAKSQKAALEEWLRRHGDTARDGTEDAGE